MNPIEKTKRIVVSWDGEGYTKGENAPEDWFIETKKGYRKWKKDMRKATK